MIEVMDTIVEKAIRTLFKGPREKPNRVRGRIG
jgi:hypothetical protein